MSDGGSAYDGREQARVKHEVLRLYLQRLAFKIGNYKSGTTLNYIDAFSGPWDAVQADHGDSSPAIAMGELAKAQEGLAALVPSKPMAVRAMFVERDPDAFQRLKKLCSSVRCEVELHQGEFAAFIQEAVHFACRGPHPFAFVFIDPTGWTGFGLQRIQPLLQVRPSEVLINFMWGHIGRFIDDKGSSAEASFDDLLGEDASKYRARWKGLEGLDREDAVVRTYCERVRAVGGFDHCVNTVIVNPVVDRTHYHLVFATRNLVGLTTFREIERRAMNLQQGVRADAKRRKRQTGGQMDLFGAAEMDSGYFHSLRLRYQGKARAAVFEALPTVGWEVAYEALVAVALGWPMTSEADLKKWLDEFETAGLIKIEGLAPRERVPKVNENHRVLRVR